MTMPLEARSNRLLVKAVPPSSPPNSGTERFLGQGSLAEHADAIRRLSRRAIADAIEIGRRLIECKQVLGHGHFGDWLAREFSWCERTAQRFISLYELASKNDNVSDLPLAASSLYLLAAHSAPELARVEILERAKRGDHMTVEDVKGVIETLRQALPHIPTRHDPASVRIRREVRLVAVLRDLERDAERMIKDIRAAFKTEDRPEFDPSLVRVARRAAEAWAQFAKLLEDHVSAREAAR